MTLKEFKTLCRPTAKIEVLPFPDTVFYPYEQIVKNTPNIEEQEVCAIDTLNDVLYIMVK